MISASVGQRCPDCARPQGRSRVITADDIRAQNSGWRSAPFTYSVIGICIGVFVLAFLPQTQPLVFGLLVQDNAAVRDGQLWRLLTSAFLHMQVFHILFNMYALSIFGPPMERQVGSASFAALYVASALAGSGAFLVLGQPGGRALGASGAVFGLFGAWLASSARNRHSLQGRANLQSLGMLLVLNLVITFVIPRIAWQAHVGGLIAGGIIAWLWFSVGMDRQSAPKRIGVASVVGAIALAVTVLA